MRTHAAWIAIGVLCACGGADGPSTASARPDLLFVTIDTLRADRLGVYGYERDTSPELDRFARGATVFQRAQAQTSWTLASLSSLMTSRWVSSLGIRDFRSTLSADATTLAEVLRAQGYETAGIGTHVVFQEKYGLLQGIDGFDADLVRESHEESHRAITSKKVTDKALEWLAARDGDAAWFLWLHYFDPHIPYARHAGITERFGDTGSDRYDGEVAFTDRHLGRVLDAVSARPEPPIVVVTSDHGEEFLDHGGREHGHTLYQELVRVPLIVSVGDGAAGRVVPDVVRLVDVTPTLLALTGVPRGDWPRGMVGESFAGLLFGRPDTAPRPSLAELRLREKTAADSLVLDRFKLVVRRADQRVELYDLQRDPRERRNLAGDRPGRVAELRAQLSALLHAAEAGLTSSGPDLSLSDEEVGVLEDLGYLGDD